MGSLREGESIGGDRGEMIKFLLLMLPHLIPSFASAITRHTSNGAFGTFMIYTLEDSY